MKNVSIIEDKKNGGIFAALVVGSNGIRAYGSKGQGAAWADWVNSEKLSMQEIEEALDNTLVTKKPTLGKNVDTDDFAGLFDTETFNQFKSDISTKQLVEFVESKSEPYQGRDEDLAFEMEHMFAEEENISNWPITDISLASIDVAYKMHAVQYKAKAFNLDRRASSMLIQVKGARAIWDPNMPGGGGYRCPDDTPNGGQFTNRLGTGCSFGVMRRIGRGLQAASLRDITQGVQGVENEAQQRAIYNLGRALEQRGAKRQEDLQSKFKRRVERRVRKMSEKDKKRNGAPSFSQIYQSLNPDMARRDRARIAVGNVLTRMGQDMSNAGHVQAQSRRLARKAKLPKTYPWDDVLDKSISPEQRRFGGYQDTQFGGFINLDTRKLFDFDAMFPSPYYLSPVYGTDVVEDAIANDPNFPFFITQAERAKLRNEPDAAAAITKDATLLMNSAMSAGQNAQRLIPSEVAIIRQSNKGQFVDISQMLDPTVSPDLRLPDKDGRPKAVPESMSSLGHVIGLDENGDLVSWTNLQEMIPLSDYQGNNPATPQFFDEMLNGGRDWTPMFDNLLKTNPNIHIAPNEIFTVFPEHFTTTGRTTLEGVIDDRLSVRNGLNTGVTFSRISDAEFKQRFPKAWKNKSKGDWRDRNTRVAQALRMYADRVQGGSATRRQGRRGRGTPSTTTTQAATPSSVPSTATKPKRSTRGAKPRVGGIIERFREGQNERLRRRTVAKRRTVQGRKPSPTDTRLERAAKRYRRRANRLAEIPDQPEDFTTYSGGLPDPAKGLEGLIRRGGADQSDIPESFRLDASTVDSIRRNFSDVDGAFTGSPDNSNGLFEAIEFVDRRSREGNGVDGIIPSVEKFDVDYVGVLNREVDEAAARLSDVLQDDRLNGTNRYRGAILGPNNEQWFFVDGVLTGVADDANGIFHQFSLDGKNHLFSVISDTNPQTGGPRDTVVASDYLRDKILGKGKRRSIRDRIMSRRRIFPAGSPAASPAGPAGGQSLRARTRQVIQDRNNPGFLFGKTTTGVKLLPGYTQQQIDALINASTVELDDHLDRWRRRLGITDLSLPIDESDVQNYLTTLRSTDPKRAAMNANDWHNTLVLAEIVSRNDHSLIEYLKPQARGNVVSRAGVPVDQTVNINASRPAGTPNLGAATPSAPAAPSTPPSPPGGGTSTPARPRGPRPPSTPPSSPAPTTPASPPVAPTPSPAAPTPSPAAPTPSPAAPSPVPSPSGAVSPAVTAPSSITPVPAQVGLQTGVDIEPNVGNAAAGITFVPQLGMYLDTNTGDYVEDLSGLRIDEALVVPAKPIDETSTVYPKVKLNGSFEQLLVAPGVDAKPLSKQVKTPAGTPSRAYTAGIFGTFKRAMVAYSKVTSGPQLGRYDASYMQHVARLDLRQLPSDPTKQAEAVLQQALQQIDATGEVFGPKENVAATLRDALSQIQSGQNSLTLTEAITLIGDTRRGASYVGLPDDPLYWKGVVYIHSGGYSAYRSVADFDLLNDALQKEEEFRLAYLANKDDIDNGVALPSDVAANLNTLKGAAAEAWSKAALDLVDKYESHATARDSALQSYRVKKSKGAKDNYIVNGTKAEYLKAIIDSDVLTNPFAVAAIGEAKRSALQKRASNFNRRRKAVNARIAAGGLRNTGLYDNDPDVLDPWKSDTPPLAARTPDVISNLSKTHKSQGIFDDATKGVAQFTDEQILMLSQMVDVMERRATNSRTVMGPAGTDLEDKEFMDVGQAHLATIWYYNGWDALPVLVNEEEARILLSQVDGNNKPQAVAITRGVQGTASEQIQYVNDALRGDRFIPGTGGSAGGRGEYFTSSPNSWSHYHGGNGGTIVGILTKDTNIFAKESFETMVDFALTPSTAELYEMFGSPELNNHNPVSISPTKRLFSSRSITKDPVTGMYDAAELAQVQKEIDDAMKVGNPIPQNVMGADGSWGRGTIESTLAISDSRLTGTERNQAFRELDPQATVEQIQESVERRAFYNAWTRQHLSWMLQLATMHRDESGPNSTEAKEYNKGLQRAMRMLTFMGPENRASIMGIDALYVDAARASNPDTLFTESDVWNGNQNTGLSNGLGDGAASRILVLNRSAMIFYNDPVGHYRDWKHLLDSITYPDGTTAMRPGMNW